MTDQPTTPREAADEIERRLPTLPWSTVAGRAVGVLVAHARATSPAPEGGGLAALRRIANKLRAGRASWLSETADDLDRVTDRIACAPAPSVATPPQEGEATQIVGSLCAEYGVGQQELLDVVNRDRVAAMALYSDAWTGPGRPCPKCAPAAPPAEGEARHEVVECPQCGTTIRARMADASPAGGGGEGVDRDVLVRYVYEQAANRAQVGGKTVSPEDAVNLVVGRLARDGVLRDATPAAADGGGP